MTERDLQRVLHESVQDVRLSDTARRNIRQATKEERPVKMKKFVAIALVAVLMLTASVGIAAELGMFDFLARKMGQEVLPEATGIVQSDLALCENEYATYHVRQAAYDGQCAVIMVDIKPKSDKILLMEETYTPDEDLIAWLIPEMEGSTQTIAEYAAEHDLTIVIAWMRNTFRGDCVVIDDWNNGTLTLMASFNATEDVLPLTLNFSATPYHADSTWNITTTSAEIELKAAEPLWTVSSNQTFDLPEYGIRIDGMTVTGTPIQCYWYLQYTITDMEKVEHFFTFDVLSSQGEWLPRGVLGVGGHPNPTAVGEQLVAHSGFGALTEAPAQLMLQVRSLSDDIATQQMIFDLK